MSRLKSQEIRVKTQKPKVKTLKGSGFRDGRAAEAMGARKRRGSGVSATSAWDYDRPF